MFSASSPLLRASHAGYQPSLSSHALGPQDSCEDGYQFTNHSACFVVVDFPSSELICTNLLMRTHAYHFSKTDSSAAKNPMQYSSACIIGRILPPYVISILIPGTCENIPFQSKRDISGMTTCLEIEKAVWISQVLSSERRPDDQSPRRKGDRVWGDAWKGP